MRTGLEINSFSHFLVQDGDRWKTNKFADASPCPVDASCDNRIWERRLLYCVPVSSHFVDVMFDLVLQLLLQLVSLS